MMMKLPSRLLVCNKGDSNELTYLVQKKKQRRFEGTRRVNEMAKVHVQRRQIDDFLS